MTRLQCFCDESHTPGRAFCIAGYVGYSSTWNEFDQAWREALDDFELAEFKMSDCVQNRNVYRNWSLSQRLEAQERFLSIIASSRIAGLWTGIDLRAHAEISARARKYGRGNITDPYFLAFQHHIEFIVFNVAAPLGDDDCVEVVFDRQEQFQGKEGGGEAKRIYDRLLQSRSIPWIQHLNSVVFGDSKMHPGIQAADVLAFEVRRALLDPLKPINRRLSILSHNGQTQGRYFEYAALSELLAELDEIESSSD